MAIAATATLAVMLHIASLQALPFVLGSFVLFAAPGTLIFLGICNEAPGSYCREDMVFIGATLGIAISSLCVAVVEYLFAANVLYQSLTLIMFSLLVKLCKITVPVKAGLRSLEDSHRSLLAVFLFVTAAALAVPYASFGEPTAKGMAFNELHKTDLLHHMVTLIELQKGIPPQNPYFAGESLHYFWLAHVLPSFAWGLSGEVIQPRDVIVLTSLLYALLFMGVLLLFLRRFYSDASIIRWLMVFVVVAYGYNSIFVAARWIVQLVPNDTFLSGALWQKLFVDNWGQQYTGYSHGWFRSFLVEPHTTLALSAVLSAIAISKQNGFFPTTFRAALVQAILLTLSLTMDAFLGMMVILSYGIFSVYQFVRFKDRRTRIRKSLAIHSAIGIFILGFMFLSKMVILGHRSLAVVPYTTMMLLSPLVLLIDYGPMFVLGMVGLFVFLKKPGEDESGWFLVVLTFVAVFFMFFVRYPDVGTQVFRKSGIVLRIALLVFSGAALQRLRGSPKSGIYRYVLVASVLLAAPSLIVDVSRISTFDKKEENTYYVNQEDYDAYAWMKQNTAPTDVIQDLPTGISNIPAFAQRRTALGDWVHAENYQVGTDRVLDRHKDIFRALFMGKDIHEAVRVMNKYHIQYLYLGTVAAKALTAGAIEKFGVFPNRFSKVYARGSVVLFRFEPQRQTQVING